MIKKFFLVSFAIIASGFFFIESIEAKSPNYTDLTFSQQVLELTNEQRINNGLRPFKINGILLEAARWLSNDMATRGELNHTDSLGRTFVERFSDFGYGPGSIAENIIYSMSAESAMNWWMNSQAHRDNILGDYKEIGVGAATSNGYYYGTQTFGSMSEPVYTFVINAENINTSSRTVTLYIGHSGENDCSTTPTEMRFSNNNETWSEWIPYSSDFSTNNPNYAVAYGTYTWELTEESGEKTVYAEFKSSCNDTIYQYSDSINYLMPVLDTTKPVYRFRNEALGGSAHFYTISVDQKDTVIAKSSPGGVWEGVFTYEGIAFYAFEYENDSCVAGSEVYRFRNDKLGSAHFYTIEESQKEEVEEKSAEGGVWEGVFVYEGVAFCAQENQVTSTSPVYRFRNEALGGSVHFYTISEEQKNTVESNSAPGGIWDGIFAYEQIAFYAYP